MKNTKMNNTKEEYNAGANGYQKATKRFMRKYAYEPTLRENLPNVLNKRVLDIACGDGLSTRILANNSAKEIIGVDISNELIKKAINFNTPNIMYSVRDAIHEDLTDLGKFDVITAIMYLHYSQSKKELKQAIRNIENILNPEGIFYTMIVNPTLQKTKYFNYGIKMTPESKTEGSRVKVELHDFQWNRFCEFTNYFWKKETYESILKLQGFETKWNRGIVSKEGIEKFGKKFWIDYFKEPIYCTITARRIKKL